jgi:hypothetical protein
MVARELTKFYRDELIMGVGKGPAKKSYVTVVDRMKNVVKRCKTPALKSASKGMAHKNAEGIIYCSDVPFGDAVIIFDNHSTEL